MRCKVLGLYLFSILRLLKTSTLVFALLTCFLGKAQTEEDTLKSHRLEFAVRANLNTGFGDKYIKPKEIGLIDMKYTSFSGYSYVNSLSVAYSLVHNYQVYRQWSAGVGIQLFKRRTVIEGDLDSI